MGLWATVEELCRRHGTSQATYYKLRDAFLQAGAEGLGAPRPHQGDSGPEGPDHPGDAELEPQPLEPKGLTAGQVPPAVGHGTLGARQAHFPPWAAPKSPPC